MELLDDEERALLEALLIEAETSGRTSWHLLRVNEITRGLMPHGRRVSALSSLQGKGLLEGIPVYDQEGGRHWEHGIDPDQVRTCLSPPKPPKPPKPRGRLSVLAG